MNHIRVSCPADPLIISCVYPTNNTVDDNCLFHSILVMTGKVLHEEHVELLMEEFAFLKKEVVGKDLLKGSLLFTAAPLEEERFGFPAFSGISRLTWLVCLFGELSLMSATLEE